MHVTLAFVEHCIAAAAIVLFVSKAKLGVRGGAHVRRFGSIICVKLIDSECSFVLQPFFGDLLGFIGAIATGPTTFWLPPLMWVILYRPAVSNVRLYPLLWEHLPVNSLLNL